MEKRKSRVFIRSEKMIPDLELERYSCEVCEQFSVSSQKPYFKALSEHGEHNKIHHPKDYPPPKIIMVYKG